MRILEVVPNIDLPALCSPKFKPGPPSEEAQVLSEKLNEVLVACVLQSRVLDLTINCFYSQSKRDSYNVLVYRDRQIGLGSLR